MTALTCHAPGCEREAPPSRRLCSTHRARWERYRDFDGNKPDLPRLPSAPLIALVERRGGPQQCGAGPSVLRAYVRAKTTGTITVWAADDLAHALFGCHPCEVWDSWFGAVENIA